AAMLFGDWGTSRLYVLGLAFFYSGMASPWHVLAMCLLLVVVAWAYTVVCRSFTDGGGVYSAAKATHRQAAVVGAFLLFASYVVTAAISAVAAFRYFGASADAAPMFAIISLFLIGAVNFVGPRHAGGLAVYVAGATLIVTVILAAFCVPHLSFERWAADGRVVSTQWFSFVHIILALSGVEAIANMTGIMVEPVGRTSKRSIWPVLAEVVLFNLIFVVAMTMLPNLPTGIMAERASASLSETDLALRDTMLRVLAEVYVNRYFAIGAAIVFGLLLLSAVNTAIAGMISVQYAMARDEEMPAAFTRLNIFGVPWVALATACGVCTILLLVEGEVDKLGHLYAIGVVGAICINLGSTCINRAIEIKTWERIALGAIAAFLFVVECTVAMQLSALAFGASVIAGGYLLRTLVKSAPAITTHLPQMADTVSKWFEEPPLPEGVLATIELPPFDPAKPKILVASRGNPDLIRFAGEEAKQRGANLLVLFVRDLAVSYGPAAAKSPQPERDPEAREMFATAQAVAAEHQIPMMPIYCLARSVPDMILDFAGTYAVDFLILGVSRRGAVFRALRGDVITKVADYLPSETTLLIHA
ncbi:MAG: amino acid permease, partial [Phycisphaerae bacterium]